MMLIGRASFGLVTQLLDFTAPLGAEASQGQRTDDPFSDPAILRPPLDWAAALGVGSLAEEVVLGEETTIERFMTLQAEAAGYGLETFLRLRNLTDEALFTLRERAAQVAANLKPGEHGAPSLKLIVDLGQPEEADLARWLPRPGQAGAPLFSDGGPEGNWSQALAFSVFARDGETALRRLERIALPLLEAAQRPGVEQPVWLAAFGAEEPGAAADPDAVIQIAAHALALGIERVFLADGPAAGWWPDHLRTPPEPLQAFRTLARCLDGATGLTQLAPGQYRIEFATQPTRYLLWKTDRNSELPAGLEGRLQVTSPLGGARRIEAGQLRLTAEPIFVAPAEAEA
jgi:hypothetical protein